MSMGPLQAEARNWHETIRHGPDFSHRVNGTLHGARIVVTPQDHLVRQSSLPHPLISRVNTASESLFIRHFEKHLREY